MNEGKIVIEMNSLFHVTVRKTLQCAPLPYDEKMYTSQQ